MRHRGHRSGRVSVYAEATVIETVSGGYRETTKFVFNNMVRFS
ncbi:hypothetical protein [Tessaracoccus flavescens]|nr:hypothetical protein [Tessaracoccus flavescens]